MVAQSSTEPKYVSDATTANQAIWLRKVLKDLEQHQNEATEIKVGNEYAVAIKKNLIQHGRTKHISVKFHAIREAEKLGEINVMHFNFEDQLGDIMTKALPKARFETLRRSLGVSRKNAKEEC